VLRTRRESRERALSLCYERDIRGVSAKEVLDALPVPADPYAERLVLGVDEHREDLDALISSFAERWSIERMPFIDRNLLRIGCFELVHLPEVPTAVVISEAVELAKEYSTDDSGRFVNGMLARIAERVRPTDRVEVPEGPVELPSEPSVELLDDPSLELLGEPLIESTARDPDDAAPDETAVPRGDG
jgi:transcription antitermination protein NusB